MEVGEHEVERTPDVGALDTGSPQGLCCCQNLYLVYISELRTVFIVSKEMLLRLHFFAKSELCMCYLLEIDWETTRFSIVHWQGLLKTLELEDP